MLHLSEPAITSLSKLPETGMGFQIVETMVLGKNVILLVLNSKQAIDLSEIDFVPGDDPATVLRNGWRIIQALEADIVESTLVAPEPHSFRLLDSRLGKVQGLVAGRVAKVPRAVSKSSLVKKVVLTANRVFYRYSAFKLDRRVDPVTGSFVPGTYASPESEKPFVPTGFVAVGRFALPNTLPASHVFEIEAPTATSVEFGTVAPAFAQAGGGVEAYFASAVINAQNPPRRIPPLPDE